MTGETLEAIILTMDEALFTACRFRFAESRVAVTLAMDPDGFKSALREKPVDAVILDSAWSRAILGLGAEEAVVKLAPLLAPRIIVVLAEQDILPEQVVKLLKLGAHDVVSRPVKPRLLAEQLKALVRVFEPKKKPDRRLLASPSGVLVLDYPRRRCYIKSDNRGGPPAEKDIRLTKIEFQVLHLMLQKKGAVATYEEFRARLWPTASSSKEIIHTLHQLTTNIRKKIAASPVKIENLRAEGFRLA